MRSTPPTPCSTGDYIWPQRRNVEEGNSVRFGLGEILSVLFSRILWAPPPWRVSFNIILGDASPNNKIAASVAAEQSVFLLAALSKQDVAWESVKRATLTMLFNAGVRVGYASTKGEPLVWTLEFKSVEGHSATVILIGRCAAWVENNVMIKEIMSVSPGNRFEVRVEVWEARNSLWVYSPSIWDTKHECCLLLFSDKSWSADSCEWLDEVKVRLVLRKFPGNHLPPSLTADIDCVKFRANIVANTGEFMLEELEHHINKELIFRS